jgi:antitoxin (DNA-binding transcriptional repressor) of toxin-antitoxin stability system
LSSWEKLSKHDSIPADSFGFAVAGAALGSLDGVTPIVCGSSDIMPSMAKHIVHISEAEAASNFADVLARVRAGAEIVIEGHEPIVVVRAEPVRGRLISECIALAKAHEEETGEVPVLDSDFAADMDEILKHRKPWNPQAILFPIVYWALL